MIDTSLEAIEQDLATAGAGGVDLNQRLIAVHRAQVRATLRQESQPSQEQVAGAPAGEDLFNAPPPVGATDVNIVMQPTGVTYLVPAEASQEDRWVVAQHVMGVPEDADPDFLTAAGYVVAPKEDDPERVVEATPEAAEPEQVSQYADDEDADLWERARQEREA